MMYGDDREDLVRGRNLLLAIDGKPHSDKAVRYAIELASLADSRLYIIYVVSMSDEPEKQASIKKGLERLEEVKALALGGGVDAVALLEGGDVYESLVSAAGRMDVGAVIVGTSEKGPLDRVLVGSVSEFLHRHSPCSVIVVR